MVIVDLKVRNKIKNQKMSREQPREEDGAMGTKVGLMSDENVETELEFCPPRGTIRISEERPIIMGIIGTETDERDPGQTNRFGSLGGAKPKRAKFELPNSRTPGPRRRVMH